MVINITIHAHRRSQPGLQTAEAIVTAVTMLGVFAMPATGIDYAFNVDYSELLTVVDGIPSTLDGHPVVVTYRIY